MPSPSGSRNYSSRRRFISTGVLLLPVLAILGARSSWWHPGKKNKSMQNLDTIHSTAADNDKLGKEKEHPSVKYVPVPSGRDDVRRYAAVQDSTDESVSIQEWMTMVSTDSPAGVRAASELCAIIVSSPYASLLFETPGASAHSSSTTPFEFALVNEPALKVVAESRPDRNAFSKHFVVARRQADEARVCSFQNLGGDAILIAPLPPAPSSDGEDDNNDSTYSHLAIFVRNAPRSQVSDFWKLAAASYLHVLQRKHPQEEKTWFSTNGMGVSWLHMRIDDRPKYYSYAPFRK